MATTSPDASSGAIAFTMAVSVGQYARSFSALLDLAHHAIHVEPLRFRNRLRLEDGCEDDLIGEREAARQRILQNVAAHGVRTRLKHDPETSTMVARAQSTNGLLDRCRMMRKIVDDGDAVDFGFDFKAPLYATECGESLGNCIFGNSVIGGQRGCGGGIPDVIFASQRKFKIAPGFAAAQD